MEHARQVKELLGTCPSDRQDEIMAWQSIKKGLPASCECMNRPLLEKLIEGVRRPRRDLPAGYLPFVARQVRGLFPKGWDLGYEAQVLLTSPPLSATSDSTRRDGGCLGTEIDHDSFLQEALSGPSRPERPRPEAELIVVQSAGKPRPLTKFSSDELLLRPLHKTIYNHLSKNKWLQRGDVTADSLERAGFHGNGGVLTSGDYKSATDGLSIEVAEVIVNTLLSSSSVIPPSVRERAVAILRPFLYWLESPSDLSCVLRRNDVGYPSVGQMMGSYLSFPLLCLQNRLAFLWSMRSSGLSWKETMKVPCLINGDDILFQSTSGVSKVWFETVGALGLEIERTKTSVDAEYGTLNSTLLRFVGGHLRVVPTLRFGRLRSSEFVNSLGREMSNFLAGVSSNCRFRAAIVWFRSKLTLLRSTRLTLHELGFRGALALRLGTLFKLRLFDPSPVVPPSPPVGHGVTLSSEEFTRVPEAEVTEELRAEAARETCAWKFSKDFVECRVKSALRYCLAMSAVRRNEPVCGVVRAVSFAGAFWPGARRTEVESRRRRQEREAFALPRESGVRSVAIPDRLLGDQSLMIWESGPPPAYGAGRSECQPARNVVGPTSEKKNGGCYTR